MNESPTAASLPTCPQQPGLGQTKAKDWELRTQSGSPTWVAGTQPLEPPPVACQSAHQQETRMEGGARPEAQGLWDRG